MTKIAVIPIDNRPICYDLIKDVLSINKDIEFFMPDISYLGGLETQSDRNKIFEFIKNLNQVDYLIVSLDTVAYGGLISSRRCSDSYEEIIENLNKFKEFASKSAEKILAFSSIMRISNNNINEEEKPYWEKYGKEIFNWSYNLHKSKKMNLPEPRHSIPDDILDDYILTRRRNYEINKLYLKWAKEGFFDTLIFSKDDCSEFGLNVQEAIELEKIAKINNLSDVFIKTGADEIPLALLSRALAKNKGIKISPVFVEDNSINLISKYEDVSVKNCALAQLALAGCTISNEGIPFIINNFKSEQGDLVLGNIINNIEKTIDFPEIPFFAADINNANGADNEFIEQLFENKNNNFLGYCGYNTSANTIGCAIFCAVVKILAQKNNSYDDEAFKRIQFIRFLDDWAYQANIRKYVRENADNSVKYDIRLKEKEEELNKLAIKISTFLQYYPKEIIYSLPWKRSFEIRIKLK